MNGVDTEEITKRIWENEIHVGLEEKYSLGQPTDSSSKLGNTGIKTADTTGSYSHSQSKMHICVAIYASHSTA